MPPRAGGTRHTTKKLSWHFAVEKKAHHLEFDESTFFPSTPLTPTDMLRWIILDTYPHVISLQMAPCPTFWKLTNKKKKIGHIIFYPWVELKKSGKQYRSGVGVISFPWPPKQQAIILTTIAPVLPPRDLQHNCRPALKTCAQNKSFQYSRTVAPTSSSLDNALHVYSTQC